MSDVKQTHDEWRERRDEARRDPKSLESLRRRAAADIQKRADRQARFRSAHKTWHFAHGAALDAATENAIYPTVRRALLAATEKGDLSPEDIANLHAVILSAHTESR